MRKNYSTTHGFVYGSFYQINVYGNLTKKRWRSKVKAIEYKYKKGLIKV